MLPFVSKRKYESVQEELEAKKMELENLQAESTSAQESLLKESQQKRQEADALRIYVAELEAKQKTIEHERDAARLEIKNIVKMHVTKIRVASLVIDASDLTSRLRGEVDPSIRVEFDGHSDGATVVVYSDHSLQDSQVNQLKSILAWDWNKT